ncbi:MAG TPA: ATP-binding protein [Gaiellaceae bacterium]|nr:ATP-binding protein [Gaiellaceae bacterium]
MVGEDEGSEHERRVEDFRSTRRVLEAGILPLATSVDGRRFSYQASLHGLELQPGSYVVLEDGDAALLGQVVTVELARTDGPDVAPRSGAETAGPRMRIAIRHAVGEGRLLAGPRTPFHDATVRPASAHEVEEHVRSFPPGRAALDVGELVLAPGVPLALDAAGFGRHTFLCGQSGSGKTYALGVVLERLLLETGLRLVVLDPNSDFVHLGELRAETDAAVAERFADLEGEIVVRRAGDGLGLRFPELDPGLQAAALRLDPVADREEYAELVALVSGVESLSLERLERLSAEGGEDARRLVERARNLGVDRWSIWAGSDGHSITADLDAGRRCLVVDIGSLETRQEQALAAATVLGELWQRRGRREAVLIVVDEAHNVCPGRPGDPLTAIATEHAVRIAGEGRKFGLYLLIASQRPQKVHENVLSQCDNLMLMRMNSLADLGFVGRLFSFVPPSLLERATDFPQGESLVAGPIAPHPALLGIGRRITAEGGGDVPADWAQPRG